MSSIRQKISLVFYAFAAIVALLSGLAFSDLRYLEARIDSGAAVSDFLNVVLELRRYEKNYFLYETADDLEMAVGFADKARDILDRRQTAFTALASESSPEKLGQLLDRYRVTLVEYARSGTADGAVRDSRRMLVRELGHELAQSAETLAKRERVELGAAVKRTQQILIWAMVLVVILGALAARILSRFAVQPIAWLEEELAAIGEGRFHRVEAVSRDREVISMSRAANRMLDEIEIRNRHLVQSEKLASLGTLVSGVAHELNNPLSNISTSCQILMEELDQNPAAEPMDWLRQIDDETERARRIVQTLLEFSRDSAFEKQPVPLRRLVEKSLLLLGRRKRARVQIDVDPALDAYADPQRLQQVLVNLVKNAQDAGGPDVQVRISASVVPAAHVCMPQGVVAGTQARPERMEGEVLMIEVTDDGPGIPPEVLPRVFDPFFTTKDVGHGSGLGLYVVVQIVDRHDGCLGVQSTIGRGSRFIICLPHPDQDSRRG